MIGDLPKIRSGLSKQADSSNRWVETLTETMHQPWFAHGRENGMAKLIAPIERVLALLKQQESKQEELKKSSDQIFSSSSIQGLVWRQSSQSPFVA